MFSFCQKMRILFSVIAKNDQNVPVLPYSCWLTRFGHPITVILHLKNVKLNVWSDPTGSESFYFKQ